MNKGGYQSGLGRLAKQIVLQYILALVVFFIAFFVAFVLAAQIYYSIAWQEDSFIYQLVQVVKEFFPLFIAAPILVGWVVITFFFISKSLRYVNEVVAAAKQLSNQKEEPIVLSSAMKEVQDELNLVREQANHNAAVAKEAEQRKNDLIVYLAHDLKTPLTSVIGYLTLLRDEGQISPELREKYLSIALEKAERLEDLINEFFEITRFNLSGITLEYSQCNLTRLLEQLTYEFQPMLLEKGLKCVLEIAPNTMIRCDVDKLQRDFDNLLRNAVNYSFANDVITIRARQENNWIHIKFINHGNTIPQEKLARIFEQFYRLDAARSSQSGGAGLGLALAKEMVELHRGAITAASENETVEFEVTLPLL